MAFFDWIILPIFLILLIDSLIIWYHIDLHFWSKSHFSAFDSFWGILCKSMNLSNRKRWNLSVFTNEKICFIIIIFFQLIHLTFFYICSQTYANESHNLQSLNIYIDKKDNILIFSFNLFLKQPIVFFCISPGARNYSSTF